MLGGMIYLFVALGALLNVAAQIALKYASQRPPTATGPFNPLTDPLALLSNPWFIGGLVLYALSVINWVFVLSRLDLSVAYPLMSLGYVLTLLAGVLLFSETLSGPRIAGIVTIMVGVILITRPVGVAHA